MTGDEDFCRWLQLSDLHVGNTESSSQAAALSLLDAEIDGQLAGRSVDFVIISGDLVYSGKAEEYRIFKSDLLGTCLAQ